MDSRQSPMHDRAAAGRFDQVARLVEQTEAKHVAGKELEWAGNITLQSRRAVSHDWSESLRQVADNRGIGQQTIKRRVNSVPEPLLCHVLRPTQMFEEVVLYR